MCEKTNQFGYVLSMGSLKKTRALFDIERKKIKEKIINYAIENIELSTESVIYKLYLLCKYMVKSSMEMLVDDHIMEFVYIMKFNGSIDRILYLIELVKMYCVADNHIVEELSFLHAKWIVITNKLLKCSILKNSDFYKRIFEIDIPKLLKDEQEIYNDLIQSEMKS